MKKYKLLIMTCLFCMLLSSVHAAQNKQKQTKTRNNNIKVGMAVPRLMTIEYERKLKMGLSAYGNYSKADLKFESIQSELKGMAAGIRYELPLVKYIRKIPFLGPLGTLFIIDYVGVSYGSLDIDYNYIQSVPLGEISLNSPVKVSAKFSGPMIEIGKDYQVGPILLGLNLSYLPGSPDIAATVYGLPVPSSDINQGAATIDGIPNITLQLGYAF